MRINREIVQEHRSCAVCLQKLATDQDVAAFVERNLGRIADQKRRDGDVADRDERLEVLRSKASKLEQLIPRWSEYTRQKEHEMTALEEEIRRPQSPVAGLCYCKWSSWFGRLFLKSHFHLLVQDIGNHEMEALALGDKVQQLQRLASQAMELSKAKKEIEDLARSLLTMKLVPRAFSMMSEGGSHPHRHFQA